ncbi:hypothetical protein A9996_00135 [Gelidibacter algens]|nr:hypothetical protein A9996_00135 [Gelidibacter algens]
MKNIRSIKKLSISKRTCLIGIVYGISLMACNTKNEDRFIFFLHNRFLETHDLEELHPEYGKTAYLEIISKFEDNGFTVLSEKRNGNVNARDYAILITSQIDSLIRTGVLAQHITVVGTSKGGYIAQYVSTLTNNKDLNFVFIGSFQELDLQNIPEINFCGNILTIYEASDPFGASALKRKENSTCKIANFEEIELHTGLRHGFLFQPLDAWMHPTMAWANGNYGLEYANKH